MLYVTLVILLFLQSWQAIQLTTLFLLFSLRDCGLWRATPKTRMQWALDPTHVAENSGRWWAKAVAKKEDDPRLPPQKTWYLYIGTWPVSMWPISPLHPNLPQMHSHPHASRITNRKTPLVILLPIRPLLILLLMELSNISHTLGGWSGLVGLRKSHCVLFFPRINPILEFVAQLLVLSKSLILSEHFFNQLIRPVHGGLPSFMYSVLPHSRLINFPDTTFYLQTKLVPPPRTLNSSLYNIFLVWMGIICPHIHLI